VALLISHKLILGQLLKIVHDRFHPSPLKFKVTIIIIIIIIIIAGARRFPPPIGIQFLSYTMKWVAKFCHLAYCKQQ
jgi:hypothetical protein